MKNNLETIKWLFRKGKKFIPAILIVAIISIVISYISVRYALVTRDVIDAAVGGTNSEFRNTLIVLVAYLFATLALRLLVRNVARKTTFKMNWFWKEELMQSVLYADYQTVNKYHSGNLLSRMTSDVQAVDDGMINFFPGVLATLTRLISAIVIMGQLEPTLTVVVCIGGILLVLCSTVLRTKLKALHKMVQEANAKLTSFMQETLERIFMVQALDVREEIEERERVLLKDRLLVQLKRKNLGLLTSGGLRIICILAEAGILVYCILKLRLGLITFGTMTAMIQLFGKIENPFINMSGMLPKYVSMVGSAERIREVSELAKDYPETVDATKAYSELTSISGKDVWFRYDDAPEEEFVISNLTFDIPKGSFCAITGDSGIGKSTLLKLLLGVCKPTKGSLNVDKTTRSMFAYVPQGNILMSGTLRENLLLTKPDATDEELRYAIEIAKMDTFVDELADGIDTKIGENALGISEGQAQRVSIARAVLSGKPIILLDEATSALDATTEENVLKNLKELPNKTIVAVTHRPAAKEMADCVIEF